MAVLADPVIGMRLQAVELQAGGHPGRSLSPPVAEAQPTDRMTDPLSTRNHRWSIAETDTT